MSTFSYLHNLKKGELTDLAELTSLPDYDSMKKPELESALDEHLKANQTAYSNQEQLQDYYVRLAPRSPVKRASTSVVSGDEKPKKPRQRRQTQVAPDSGVTSEPEAPTASSTLTSIVKTPARQLSQRVRLPPSPAVVSDTVERTTAHIKRRATHYYSQSGISETRDWTREFLSDPGLIQNIPNILEAATLVIKFMLPLKKLGEIQKVPYLLPSGTDIKVPDFFVLLTSQFWKPFWLWSLTALIIPGVSAYLFNVSMYHAQSSTPSSRSSATRRTSSANAQQQQQVDPLVFSIVKALVTYMVYAQHVTLLGMTDNHDISKVNELVFGGYGGMLTGAGVAGLIGIYDAVLKR
ncbi:MAG: hypothetical protein Q9227_001594 [Pyrenula ochraceoflavens]